MTDPTAGYRDEFLTAVDTERHRQIEKLGWSAEKDERHEPHDWIGLTATYLAQGRWVQAGALCAAAYEAQRWRVDNPPTDPDRPQIIPCIECKRTEWSNTHQDPEHPEYHAYAASR
jgi:hypothetical protein